MAVAERLAYRVLAEGWRLQERVLARPTEPAGGPELPAPPPGTGLRELAVAVREGRIVRPSGEIPAFCSRDVGDLVRVLGPIDISRLPAGGPIVHRRRSDPAP